MGPDGFTGLQVSTVILSAIVLLSTGFYNAILIVYSVLLLSTGVYIVYIISNSESQKQKVFMVRQQ